MQPAGTRARGLGLAAGEAAQEAREPPRLRRDQVRASRAEDLPADIGGPDGEQVPRRQAPPRPRPRQASRARARHRRRSSCPSARADRARAAASVRPTIAGRSTVRSNTKLGAVRRATTATAPGQGSAATARYCRTVGSPRATGRSSTIGSRRSGDERRPPHGFVPSPAAASKTDGSTRRASRSAARSVGDADHTVEPRTGLGRQDEHVARLDREMAPGGSSNSALSRPAQNPAARHRRDAAPRRGG